MAKILVLPSEIIEGQESGNSYAFPSDNILMSDKETTVEEAINTKPGEKIPNTSDPEQPGGEIFNDYENNIASGNRSHAEGYQTTASGYYAHAEGMITTASGPLASHAEGTNTTSSGMSSHSEGSSTVASGNNSHAEGSGTIASSNDQHAQGRYNIEDADGVYAHIVGWGTSPTSRANIHTITTTGDGWFAGKVSAGTTESPATPTENNDLITKKYFDNELHEYAQKAPVIVDVFDDGEQPISFNKTYSEIVSYIEDGQDVVLNNFISNYRYSNSIRQMDGSDALCFTNIYTENGYDNDFAIYGYWIDENNKCGSYSKQVNEDKFVFTGSYDSTDQTISVYSTNIIQYIKNALSGHKIILIHLENNDSDCIASFITLIDDKAYFSVKIPSDNDNNIELHDKVIIIDDSDNIELVDSQSKHYILNTYTSGDTTIYTYNDGTKEMYFKYSTTVTPSISCGNLRYYIDSSNSYGNQYYQNVDIPVPEGFTNITHFDINNVCSTGYPGIHVKELTTSNIGLNVTNISNTTELNITFYIHIIGN